MTETEYIKMLMKNLHCTEEAARDVMITDRAIDRGADPFPISQEQKGVEKQMRQADRKKETAPRQRARKVDLEKREIIQVLDDALFDLVDEISIINPERQIDFVHNNKNYRLVLSVPRKQGGAFCLAARPRPRRAVFATVYNFHKFCPNFLCIITT